MSLFGTETNKMFAMVEPIAITDAMYAASDPYNTMLEPETTAGDPSGAWSAATAYVIGDRVYHVHKIYERLVAGTTATAPASDPDNWLYVSPTNAWKMFDASNSTQSVGSLISNLVFTIALGAGDDPDIIVFDNTDCGQINLSVWDSATSPTVKYYDETIDLRAYDVTKPWAAKRAAVFTGLPASMGSKVIWVVATPYTYGTTNAAKIGTMVIGTAMRFGVALSGFGAGIIDYSRKVADDFGNYTVVQRTYAKRMSGTVAVQSTDVDGVVNLLAQYRATPAMYLAVGDQHAAMIMYGFYKSFDVTVRGPTVSYCAIDVEGLT